MNSAICSESGQITDVGPSTINIGITMNCKGKFKMSARLKLKNLKKRIETIESYGRHCEYEMARMRKILENNVQQIGVDCEIPPMGTIQDAMGITDMTINKLTGSIVRAYTETLATFIKHKIYQLQFTHNFQRISVRFFAPKINDEHIKIWPIDKIDH